MNAKWNKLSQLVKAHESFWSKFASKLPTRNARSVMRTFYRKTWDPFYMHWTEVSQTEMSDTEQEYAADDAGKELSAIRDIARSMRIPVPSLTHQSTSVAGWTDSLRNLLRSKEAKEMAPFIPYGSLALGTISKIDEVVSNAKDGDPVAREKVKQIKLRSDLGDPEAEQALAVVKVVSKAQNIKAQKRSFYAKGMSVSVGHDPITFGAVRDQRGGKGGGGGTSVTSFKKYAPPKASRAVPTSIWHDRSMERLKQEGMPVLANLPQHLKDEWKKYDQQMTPQGPPPGQQQPPPGYDPYADPYGQQNPYGGYDPYGGYGGSPYGGYDPYAGYGGFNPYGGYGGYNPYGLQGLPPGYGYEEPVIDRGGFQQYDPNTGMFYSSNQKQVYDEATGYFVPMQDVPNPYGF